MKIKLALYPETYDEQQALLALLGTSAQTNDQSVPVPAGQQYPIFFPATAEQVGPLLTGLIS